VVGFGATDAGEILTRAGLVPAGPGSQPPPDSGTVCAQHPPARARATAGATVVLDTETGHRALDVPPQPDTGREPAPA
jgi:hypothetical protein